MSTGGCHVATPLLIADDISRVIDVYQNIEKYILVKQIDGL